MSKYQTKYSADKFWNDILLHVPTTPSTPVPPTVTTDSLVMHFNSNCDVDGSVTDVGTSAVTDAGFVWATHDNPTLEDNVVDLHLSGDSPFSYDETVGSLPFPATVYFAAYAVNEAGVSYGNVLSGETQICFAEGTLVTMADRSQKKIEDIRYTDDLLVWNFDEAIFDHAKPVWMVRPFKANYYGLLKFSDGTELKTVHDGRGHRIYNIEQNMFTYSMDAPIGTTTFTAKKEQVKLIDKQIVRKDTMFYNVVTHTHFNMFTNEILTSTGLNNIYPIVDMKFVKEVRIIRHVDMPKDLVVGLRLGEQLVDVCEKVKIMMDRQWNI